MISTPGHRSPSSVGLPLQDRHVLLTGATRGIGRALATELAERGGRLSLVARNADALAAVASAVGGRAVPGDLTDLDALPTIIERAQAAHGPIDVLVNNAGINTPMPLARLSEQQLSTMLLTNFVAPILLIRPLLDGMLARDSGAIVNVSSIGGELSLGNMLPYCASKNGLTSSTRALQVELRGTGVNATLVTLGLVGDTDMVRDTQADPAFATAIQRSRRMSVVKPETVAEKIADAIESGRKLVALPGAGALAHHLRHLPTYAAYGLMYSRRGAKTSTDGPSKQ